LVATDDEKHFTLDELAGAIDGLLGAFLSDVGRTLNMVEIGLRRDAEVVRLHVQCPVRILQGSSILLGSQDYLWPHPPGQDRQRAFDQYETMFDRAARTMTAGFGNGLPVLEAAMRPDGSFHLQASDNIRVEVFPAVSGPIECWRLFFKGSDVHHVYPPGTG
jgi:hypothetical protein